MTTFLVCGSRHFKDEELVRKTLHTMLATGDTLIVGDAPGADTLAKQHAPKGVTVRVFKAQWDKYGKKAGPIRNQRMLDVGKPDIVLAFPGGRGTADMVRRAKRANKRVYDVGAMK